MPVLSTTDPNVDKRDYFDSLNDLDKWASEGFPQSVVDDVLPYRARSEDISGDLNLRGKLQVNSRPIVIFQLLIDHTIHHKIRCATTTRYDFYFACATRILKIGHQTNLIFSGRIC